jgi:hypothetical protein
MRRATLCVIGLAAGFIGIASAPAEAQVGRAGVCAPGGPCGGLVDPYGYRRFYYSPYRYLARPRLHAAPNGTGLQYYRFMHPYSDYDYYRRTYPHSIDGTFGRAPRPRDLTLRFRTSPGLSPYSRYHHEEALFGEGAIDPGSPDAEGYESGALRDLFRDLSAPAPAPPAQEGDDGGYGHEVFVPVPQRRATEPSADEKKAWAVLGRGDGRAAEDRFSTLALAYLTHGRPKAGFALSRALQGQDGDAVWNMRRAVSIDGASLRDVPMTDALEAALRGLLARYAADEGHDLGVADATFMTAALHYVLRELDEAREATHAAIMQHRDADQRIPQSALRLLMLIREDLGEETSRGGGRRASARRNGV